MSLSAGFYGGHGYRPSPIANNHATSSSTLDRNENPEVNDGRPSLYFENSTWLESLDYEQIMRDQQNIIPSVVEEIKISVGELLRILQNEITELRAEVTRMKESTQEHRLCNSIKKSPTSTSKSVNCKFLTVRVFACFSIIRQL